MSAPPNVIEDVRGPEPERTLMHAGEATAHVRIDMAVHTPFFQRIRVRLIIREYQTGDVTIASETIRLEPKA